MKKLTWPESVTSIIYVCAVCNKNVLFEFNADNDGNVWYTPASRYWNSKKNEVYCSAIHSLEKYENN